MVTVIPAILQLSRSGLESEIQRLGMLSPFLHVDVTGALVDAPPMALSPRDVAEVLEADTMGVQFNLHLMLTNDELQEWIPPLVGVEQVASVVIHHEIGEGLLLHAQTIRAAGKSAIVAVNPGTPIEAVDSYAGQIDGVVVMGVVPGAQGKPFEVDTFDRVKILRKKYPKMMIVVDGAVSLEDKRAQLLAQAGADTLIVGSKIRDAHDPRAVFDAFTAAVNQ